MKWRTRSVFLFALAVCAAIAYGQSLPNGKNGHSTANLTVSATVVPSVGITVSPDRTYSIVAANIPALDNVSRFEAGDAKSGVSFFLPSRVAAMDVSEQSRLVTVIQAGKAVHGVLRTTTVVAK
jgi:hypothetical protein